MSTRSALAVLCLSPCVMPGLAPSAHAASAFFLGNYQMQSTTNCQSALVYYGSGISPVSPSGFTGLSTSVGTLTFTPATQFATGGSFTTSTYVVSAPNPTVVLGLPPTGYGVSPSTVKTTGNYALSHNSNGYDELTLTTTSTATTVSNNGTPTTTTSNTTSTEIFRTTMGQLIFGVVPASAMLIREANSGDLCAHSMTLIRQ